MRKKIGTAVCVLGLVILGLVLSQMVNIDIDVGVVDVQAAPLRAGDTPIYDSGWFTMTTSDWITHSLDAIPTDYVILVSDGSAPGNYVTAAAPWFWKHDNGKEFGHTVTALCRTAGNHDVMKIYWAPDGVAWSDQDSRWFERGEDAARVLIFAASNVGGCPYRP